MSELNDHRYTLTLPSGRTNKLVEQGMLDAIEMARRSRWADIMLRKDGEWVRLEADWLRYLIVRRQPRWMSLLDIVPRAIRRLRWKLLPERDTTLHGASSRPETQANTDT